MQTLTAKEVAKKALEFYECGKLTAQKPQQLRCMYIQPNGCRCAIGAGLSDEVIALLRGEKKTHNHKTLWNLRSSSIIDYDSYDSEMLCRMQELHDAWHAKMFQGHATEARDRFLDYVRKVLAS
jgi:hypothetical protein